MNSAHPVVVLGATGLLGQALVQACIAAGRPVVGLSRVNGVDFASAFSPLALHHLLDSHQPALVVNAVAITDLAACEDDRSRAWVLHAQLPGALAAWSRATGTPWVQVSTDHYFSGEHNTLHDEHATVAPLNEYARSKLAGEALALTSPQALVLRTNIVGRRGWPGRPSFAEWVHERLRSGESFAGYTDVWASSLAASQCAEALLALADSGARGLLNLAATESISKVEFIAAFAAAAGLSATGLQPQTRPTTAPGALQRANALGLDVRRAQALLAPLGLKLPNTEAVAQALAQAFQE
jgi:dTDP-4-dehydrorhamnose reductase